MQLPAKIPKQRIYAGWRRCRLVFIAPRYTDTPEYENATKWLGEFKPIDSDGYVKGLEYAWKMFEKIASAGDALDRKADNIIKSAGLIAGLLGLAINTLRVGEPTAFAPALIAFVVSLLFAAVACSPTANAASAGVNDLLDDITDGKHKDAFVAASIHCAIAGCSAVNDWKARRIRWSTTAFVIGLCLLLLPIIALLSVPIAVVVCLMMILFIIILQFDRN
jgi:hypothetical protein